MWSILNTSIGVTRSEAVENGGVDIIACGIEDVICEPFGLMIIIKFL